uniref:Uncharacterized protein n=1 Tax=Cacopsylla melanoneura TaxID=428564 RepID=A0A8D8WPR1_9HEMI
MKMKPPDLRPKTKRKTANEAPKANGRKAKAMAVTLKIVHAMVKNKPQQLVHNENDPKQHSRHNRATRRRLGKQKESQKLKKQNQRHQIRKQSRTQNQREPPLLAQGHPVRLKRVHENRPTRKQNL